MVKATLFRISTSDKGTFGVIIKDNVPICTTLEEPWRDNKQMISCIPEGIYHCVPHSGTRFKNVWRLENVPGRDAVLIHNGNTLIDTEGCILVGMGYGNVNGCPAVTHSAAAIETIRRELGKEFDLEIKRVYN